MRPRINPYWVVLILLSLFAWAPLLYPGYMQVHSGFLPLLSLENLATSSEKLRWLPTVGVGTNLWQGEGPLAYWLALLWRPLLGGASAIKAVFGLSFLLAGFGLLTWSRTTLASPSVSRSQTPWGQGIDDHDQQAAPPLATWRAALLAAVALMLWPYLIATVYVRGALAEALFMGVLPWVAAGVTWGRWQLTGSRGRAGGPDRLVGLTGSLIAIALGVLVLFLIQPGLTLWAAAVLLAWAIWPGATYVGRLATGAAVIVGAAMGLGFLWLLHGIPGPGDSLAAHAYAFSAHAVHPYQLFTANWGFGTSTPGWQDDLSFQLGLPAVGLAVLAGALLVAGVGRSARRDETPVDAAGSDRPAIGRAPEAQVGFALVVAAILILLTTTLARPLWRWVPLLAWPLAYPWQLFALVGPLLALTAGAAVVLERRLATLTVWAGLVALVVLSSYPYLTARFTPITPDAAQVTVFGDGQILMLGAEIAGPTPPITAEGEEIRSSQILTVTVAWQGLTPLDFDYNVFVHAVDGNDSLLAQWDGQPQRGDEPYPMTAWSVGEIIPNAYRLELDDDTAAQLDRINLGLYNWQTGDRLPAGAGDRATVEVGP